MNDFEFEWDEAKNNINLERHGIDFHRASLIFKSAVYEQVDDRFDYGEVRIVALGLVGLSVFRVVFTESTAGVIRIISAQKAERHEREIYYRQIYS